MCLGVFYLFYVICVICVTYVTGKRHKMVFFLTPLRTQNSNLLAVVPEKGFFFETAEDW